MIQTSETTPNSGTKPRIVFFGNERIATAASTKNPTLRMLIAANYPVVAVVANNHEAVSRKSRTLEVEDIANEHGIPFYRPEKLSTIRDELASLRADVAVLVAYGKMVPQEIINLFPRGIVNIHPSLLPKHRGSTPIESVILSGEAETGVSLMQIVQEMDAGPVYAVTTLPLRGDETKQALADTLATIGAKMLQEMLPGIISGDILPQEQNHTEASYDQLIHKADGLLDFNKSAVQLEREIRAFAEWPKSRTTIAGKEVIITKAHVLSHSEVQGIELVVGRPFTYEKQLCIPTKKDMLVIDALKPNGKSEMPATAFLAGYGKDL